MAKSPHHSGASTSSTQESRTEVPTGGSFQQLDAIVPSATLSHDAPVTSPDHCPITPSALAQATYEWIMEGEESTIDPPSSQYSYPMLPPVTISSTISILPSMTPAYYVDVLPSSSNMPSYDPSVYSDGVQAQSPSGNIPVHTKDPPWPPSEYSRFITFLQGNPYPHYPQVTEQQHLDSNPAQTSNDTFGAVQPQVYSRGIMALPYDFWSGEAPYSSGTYRLNTTSDTVAYTSTSNTLDSVTYSQSFGYQYAPQYADSVLRGLDFTQVTDGLDSYYQAQEATPHLYYQYDENYSSMLPPQATLNGSFVADDQTAWDEGSTSSAGAYWYVGDM